MKYRFAIKYIKNNKRTQKTMYSNSESIDNIEAAFSTINKFDRIVNIVRSFNYSDDKNREE
jgi:hypothetical protein